MNSKRPIELPLVAAGFIWFTLMGLAVTMTGPLSVAITGPMGQPATSQAQLGTALFAGAALMLLSNALFSAQFSGRWVARFCTASYLVGCLLCALTQSWAVFLFGLSLIGAGNGGMSVWFNAEFARSFGGKSMAAWLTALNGFWAVGAVIGPFLVGQWVDRPQTPHMILAGIASVSLVVAFLIKPRPPAPPKEGESLAQVPPIIFGLMVLLGLYVGVEAATIMLMQQQLMAVHSMSLPQAAQVASALWLAFMLGRFGAGPIAARVHPSRIVIGCATLASAAMYGSTIPGLAWPSYIALGLAMGPVFPAVIAWGTGLSEAAHRVTSLMILGPCFTAVLFPGLIASTLGNRYAMFPWIALGLHVLILLLTLIWKPRASVAAAHP